MDFIKPPYFGAAYYPEGVPAARIQEDISQMEEMGINAVRLGEFAWSRMEPEDGRFDFTWLHRTVDLLADRGIGVILCTPSATPPAWLTEKHPGIMPVRFDGRRASHGARLHYCPNSDVYRSYIHRIVAALANEFTECRSVLGWQVDNEVYIPFGEGCYCPDCERGFRAFLESRFETIGQMNEAWQLTLWSQEYQSFAQVPMPRPDTAHHPSLKMAWLEFQERSVIRYVDFQVDILKQRTGKPVSTDMMPLPLIDHVKMNRKTDVVMFNHYNSEESLPHAFFWFDYLKTIKDVPFWNTETDPNANGGTSLMPYKPQGFCTVNSWLAMAFGGEANLYWHWRGHRAGHELMHGSAVDSYGHKSYTFREMTKIAGDLRTCSDFLNGTKPKQARVAIHYSSLAEKLFACQSISPDLHYWTALFSRFYFPLIRAGIRVDVISPKKDLSPYEIVLSPMLATLDEGDLRMRLERWIGEGGTWIAGPLTDVRDIHGAKMEKPFGSLDEWGGFRTGFFATPNPAYPFNLHWQDGRETGGGIWYQGFMPAGAETLAQYGSRSFEFEGLAAITANRKGRGTVIAFGTVPEEEDYLRIVRPHMSSSADFVPRSSDNILCVPREGTAGEGALLLEYRNRSGTLAFGRPAIDLISGNAYNGEIKVPPYGVMLLKTSG